MVLVFPSVAAGNNEPWIPSANNWQQGEELLPAPVPDRIKCGSVRGVRRSNTWFGKLDRGESIPD